MNEAKAIELAIANTIRQFGEIGQKTLIRPWQSLDAQHGFDTQSKDGDRFFPCIDIRCGTAALDEDQSTWTSTAPIIICTKTEDDETHAEASSIYEAVKGVTDSLFKQFRTGVDGDELTFFKAQLTDHAGTAFHWGGLSYAEGSAPAADDNLNMIDIVLVVYHSRTDF